MEFINLIQLYVSFFSIFIYPWPTSVISVSVPYSCGNEAVVSPVQGPGPFLCQSWAFRQILTILTSTHRASYTSYFLGYHSCIPFFGDYFSFIRYIHHSISQANFGNLGLGPMELLKPLPFTARLCQEMLSHEAVVSPVQGPKPGQKWEVVLPIGVPDEGTFDWVDYWTNLPENRGKYVEISDRKVSEKFF